MDYLIGSEYENNRFCNISQGVCNMPELVIKFQLCKEISCQNCGYLYREKDGRFKCIFLNKILELSFTDIFDMIKKWMKSH